MKFHRKILTAAVLGLVAISGSAKASTTDELKAAIRNNSGLSEYTYELDSDITNITSNLGTMSGNNNYALTINGNNYGISGNGEVGGIRLDKTGQSLILNEIGSYTTEVDSDGRVTSLTVLNSMNGFKLPTDSNLYGVIYSKGTTTITDSVFSNNAANWGGVVNNGGNLTITGSVFYQNSGTGSTSVKTEGGGAIFNKKNATITNSIFYENQAAKGGAIANVIDTKTSSIGNLTIRNSQFIKNSVYDATSDDIKISGGAICNNAIIDIIDGSYFAENKASYQGSAISNSGTINTISNTIFENNESTAGLGTIYNYNAGGTDVVSTIDTISNVQILNNTGVGIYSSAPITTLSNVEISGNTGNGIELYSTIGTITGSKFSNNTGSGTRMNYGIKLANSSASIDLIENTEISGNKSGGIYINGGRVSLIKNSLFLNNWRDNPNTIGDGSGLWTNTDVKIQSDNGITKFQGNLDKNNPSGIWVNSNKTLTLDQINSGKMYFYDPIRGGTSYYNVNITGDGTGTLYLYNNITNGKVTTGNTNIDTADGNLFDYSFRSLSTSSNTNWKIDVDFANEAADTFTTGTLTQTNAQYVKLKDINFLDDNWDSIAVGGSITKSIRILTTQSNKLQLSLDESISGENVISSTEVEAASSWDDVVGATTSWADGFYHWDKDATNDVITSEYSITSSPTGTENDSLTIEISRALVGGDVHQGDSLGDALALVNKATTQATKAFNAAADGDSYSVANDTNLGDTYGTVNINGVHGGNAEVINLNNSSFVLGDDATALNFKDVTVEGSDTIATVSNSTATIKLEDSILNGAIVGTAENNFNMTTAGTSEINADVTKANISNTGILTTTAEHIANSTITNVKDANNNIDSTLILSGALAKEILGGGTTKINSNLTFNNGASIAGTLNMNGGLLTVSENATTSHNIGAFSGDGNMAIDLRLSNANVDNFTATGNSTGTITLTSVNILDPSTVKIDPDFLAKVLNVPTGSSIQLALSQAVQNQFNANEYIIQEIDAHITKDSIQPNSSWTQGLYEEHSTTAETVYGKLKLSDDKHSIVVYESDRQGGITTDSSLGDTLKLVNQDTTNSVKNFTAQNSGMTYTAEDSLGNTKGTVNINGIHGDGTETLNLNNNSGFVLGDGAIALNFKDVTVGGSDTVATVSNSAATVKLEDSILNGAITGTGESNFNMTTTGTSEINANVTKANISNTGTLTTTAEYIANSTITNVKDDTNNIDSTLILSGALAKEILGGGTTKINSNLTFNNGASIAGTLNMNGGNLTISDGTVTNHTVGNISGNGNISLDFDGTNIDTITLTNDTSAATLTINSLSTPANTTDFEQQVLFGADSNTVLELSQDVLDVYNKTFDKDMSGDTDLTTSTIKWNDNYGTEEWTETYQSVLSVTGSSDGLMDTLLYETSMIGESEHVWNPKADNLRLINVYDGQGAEDRTFLFDTKDDVYTVTRDLGTTTAGTLSVLGKAESTGDSRYVSTIDFGSHKGFDLDNDDTTLILKDVGLMNAGYIAKSGNESSVINLDGVILDGSNGEGIETSGRVNILGGSVVDDKITLRSVNSSINVDGSDEVSLNGKFTGVGELNLENGSVYFGNRAQVSGLDTNMSNVSVTLENENSLSGINLAVNNPSTIVMANNRIGTLALNNVTLNGALNMTVDADLANRQMDKITAVSAAVNDTINVQKINLLSATNEKELSLLFTNNKDLATAVNYTGEGTITYSPIYKYKTSYDIENDMGYFKFGLVSGGHSPSDFNPAVLASPVMAQAGLMQSMNATMHYAFEHLDGFTKFNARDRFAKINANKYAIQSTDFNQNMQLNSLYENRGVWTIPYASFENVHLKNGPRVDVNSYGTFTGFDTDIKQLKHGWNTVTTGYIGYNGAHMSYNGVSTNMNGGMLGGTQTWYKGNFWTAVTAAVGASVADSDTMYGHEDYTSILSGIGSKTGYNWELAQGKFIIQPIWFMNYSLMKTFDYTNAAGVRINSNPISTVQLNPSVRFIGNLNHGWQPYASVGMVWNLTNGTHVKAAGVKLPEMSVKPYVEYGVGVQKQVGDNFTGYMQAMLRNGGRNGIALTGGFRWALGKKQHKIEKVENTQNTINRKVIKQL